VREGVDWKFTLCLVVAGGYHLILLAWKLITQSTKKHSPKQDSLIYEQSKLLKNPYAMGFSLEAIFICGCLKSCDLCCGAQFT